jgi:trimeric autotransporter adhesin
LKWSSSAALILPACIAIGLQGITTIAMADTASDAKLAPSTTDKTVRRASDFVDSVGINTHIDAATTTYENVDMVARELNFLGLHFVREDPYEGGLPLNPGRFKKLIDAGIKLDLDGGGGNTTDVPTMIKGAEAIEKAYPGSISSVEGYNEVDDKRHPITFQGKSTSVEKGDYDAATDVQAFLYKSVHEDPTLKNIPVLSFSFAWFDRSDTAKDASAFADYANIHAYAVNGAPPRSHLMIRIAGTKQVHGKPIIMTETGYPTIFPSGPTLKNLVDESVQQSFLLDSLFDNFSNGVVRTYIYELMDRRVNPGDTTDQWHYGIFRADGTPKPAASGVKNLLTIMSSGLTAPNDFDISPLEYSISPEYREPDSKVPNYSSVFEKKPGVYDIAVWSEPQIWDPKTFTVVKDPSINVVTIKFTKRHQTILVFDPTLGSEPVKMLKGLDQVKLQITDHPLIVEVKQ